MKQERYKFDAVLEKAGEGDSWIIITIPPDVDDALGTRGRVSVRGEINKHAFESSLFADGKGGHHLMINKSMQKGANAGAGDIVRVVLEPIHGEKPRLK